MSWLQELYKYGKQILALTQKVERHETDIEKIRVELSTLTKTVERVIYEIRHDRDAAEKDREIVLLRLENQLLRFERRLPPPTDNPQTDDNQ